MKQHGEGMYFHALAVAHRGSYRELRGLRDRHPSWRAAWDSTQGKNNDTFLVAWHELQAAGIALTAREEEGFPTLVREIAGAPFGLYTKGTALGSERAIAIVGTRKATSVGLDCAEAFAKELARAGVTVVSGLAFGIDAAAHKGAIKGGGKTVAVLANGLDRVYPRTHEGLAKEIIAHGGTLVSEYPMGTPPLKPHFIERNRIVSGLTQGVVVIEAPKGSGALATARFALDQNREVMVVPGPIKSLNYEGSHALIKEGAALIDSVEDIFNALEWPMPQPSLEESISLLPPAVKLDATALAIVNLLRTYGRSITPDKIATLLIMDISSVNRSLSRLVIHNMVKENAGQFSI